MTIDPNLVAKAIEILKSKKVSSGNVESGVSLLEGYRLFEDMETEELEAYVKVALGQLGTSAAASRPATSGSANGRGGGKARELPSFTSPFVFVTLPDEVVSVGNESPVDLPIRDGLCATIDYKFEAETPLLIGGDVERQDAGQDVVLPMRFGNRGNYVIPGATIRGLVRAAVEIVSHAKLGSSNLHHRFGLRDFEHPYYEQVAKVALVKAGWLVGQVDRGKVTAMQITPCDWAHVLIDDMASSAEFHGRVSQRANWITKSLKDKYAALGMVVQNAGQRTEFSFSETFGFGPSVEDNGRQVRKPARGGTKGVPVVSGKLPGSGGNKKFEYAFFDRIGAAPVDIKPDLIEDFVRLNSKPSKNRPAADGSWKELKDTFEAGRRIPVFYVGDLEAQGGDFFFGLTRMMKLPHRRTVNEVLGQQPNHIATAQWQETVDGKQEILRYNSDFAESLFGFVVEPRDLVQVPGNSSPQGVARKGRVAFSFAKLVGGPESAELSAPVTVVQSAPRASFAPFYLKPRLPGQKDAEADYSAEKSPRLAGRKRYLPRDARPDVTRRLHAIEAMGQRQLDAIRGSSGGRTISSDVQSKLRFLLPTQCSNLLFEGTIRLHNVTAAELGAVLFALAHGGDPKKPYRHMIGRAKPFGAGQMRLHSLDLAVEANSGAEVVPPDADELLAEDWTGFCSAKATASLKPFLKAFTEQMRKQRGLQAFPNVPAVLEFLGASDPSAGALAESKLEYMSLAEFNPVRKATKPLKDFRAGPPARGTAQDGRLLPAPKPTKPVFWT